MSRTPCIKRKVVPIDGKKARRFVLPALTALLLLSTAPRATASVGPLTSPAGLVVQVDGAAGTYTVRAAASHWVFQGSTGTALSDVRMANGQDRLGSYQQISFNWVDRVHLAGSIRNYQERPIVVFAITNRQACSGPPPDFPSFTSFPRKLHELSFKDQRFSPHTFGLAQNGTPWILFDDTGETAVLSSGSGFLVSEMQGNGRTRLASGLNRRLSRTPTAFTHRSFLVIGDGIGKTLHTWGDALTDLSRKPRPADDAGVLIKRVGYWTDNGSHYYYNYDRDKGYAGTLLALRQYYQREHIPLGYLQLDSWWYQKSRRSPEGRIGGPKNASLPEGTWNAYGGTLDYSASPDLFPRGLASFQRKLGLPLVVHGRWIDPASPYRLGYDISGIAPIDLRWWEDRMAYLRAGGVVCYEQDWLDEIYAHSPDLSKTVHAGDAFTDNMARAARDHGLTLQYCMATPRFFLQSSRYANLTTIRASDDRFGRSRWNDFLYTSLLADCLRVRPWTDVFMSTEPDNLTLSVLSSGPVGIGDAMGKESRPQILKAIRSDGVIVKPDAPIAVTDASILADARKEHRPLLAATFTDNGIRTAYLFACARKGDSTGVSFTPASFGIDGDVIVYDTVRQVGKRQRSTDPFEDYLDRAGWDLYIAAPLGRCGIALLGDASKIVGTGRQRLAAVHESDGQLIAAITTAPGEEPVTLHGYALSAPSVSTTGIVTVPLSYDPTTLHFSVTVAPAAGARPQLIGGDPVNQLTVVFTSGSSAKLPAISAPDTHTEGSNH